MPLHRPTYTDGLLDIVRDTATGLLWFTEMPHKKIYKKQK